MDLDETYRYFKDSLNKILEAPESPDTKDRTVLNRHSKEQQEFKRKVESIALMLVSKLQYGVQYDPETENYLNNVIVPRL